jgi:hypothetical protein
MDINEPALIDFYRNDTSFIRIIDTLNQEFIEIQDKLMKSQACEKVWKLKHEALYDLLIELYQVKPPHTVKYGEYL